MKKYTKAIFQIFIIFLVLPCLSNASTEPLSEFEEIIKKTFDFNTSQPSILLENSYGDLTITSSDSRNAIFEITITVEAKSKSRAEELFSHIDIEFDDDPDELEVKTNFIGKNGGWAKKSEKFTVDYKVSLPKEAFLSLKNKYGDISLTDHSNDVEVNLKYGSGSLQQIGGDLELNLAYADKFYVGEIIGLLESKLKYSHLRVEKAQSIDCVSAYSNVTFDEIESIDCDSKYDEFIINRVRKVELDDKYSNYSIGFVEDIFVDMAYSEIRISNMSKQGVFDTSYGSVNMRNIEKSADRIDIESGHTGYRIGYDGGLTLNIQTEYTNVKYPEDLTINSRDRDDNELNLKGRKEGSGDLKITATMEYGSLKIGK